MFLKSIEVVTSYNHQSYRGYPTRHKSDIFLAAANLNLEIGYQVAIFNIGRNYIRFLVMYNRYNVYL